MRTRTISRRVSVLAVIAFAVTAGGVAYATIPGSNGTINGCYEKRTGILRVIDSSAGAKCLSFETPISWNQQGQRGATGAAGPQGPTGPKGERGAQGESGKLALAGQRCPADGSVTGFDAEGNLVCSGSGTGGGDGEGPATEPLTVTPVFLNFGVVTVYTVSARLRVTVTNPNSVAVNLQVAVGNASYRLDSTCAGSLPANGSCWIDVSFAPVIVGSVSTALTINAEALPVVSVTLLGTGA